MRVLVTGGAGYIGSVLVEGLLESGHTVLVLDNLVFGQQSLLHLCGRTGFEFVRGDARDEATLRSALGRVDAIIPLAAIVGAPACQRDPWLARSLNVDAVRLLLQLRSPSQLIVFPTTNSGYGTRTDDRLCTEETPLEPITLYGQTKSEAEKAVLEAGNAITLRLATVFGVSSRMRIDLLVNHWVYAAVTDGYLVVFEKEFRRNFVHVRDVADAFLHCLAHADSMNGQCYNFGLDTANLSKEQLALKIREHVPRFLIHFADIGTDPDKRNYVVTSAKMERTGLAARRTLDQGIVELIQAYRMIGPPPHANA